jgi:ribonuclease HI
MKSIEIYTDGACSGNPGPGGWAAVLSSGCDKVITCGHDSDTTNNRMELIGFINGLEMALNSPDLKPGTQINIYTDSKYIENPINLKWLDRWMLTHFDKIKNSDLWIRLYELISMMDVNVTWIPREENAVADEIAKNARDGMYGSRATMIL